MKHKLQTLLKHELQWLVLLAALFGVSHGVWGNSKLIPLGNTIYFVDNASWGACQMYYWYDGGNNYVSFTKITNTLIYYYDFDSDWWINGYKFRNNTSWSKQSSGDITGSISSDVYYAGTSTTANTDMTKLNGTAKFISKISTNGGTSYSKTANANCKAKISGKNLGGGNTSTTSVSNETGSSSEATIYPAYGSTVEYTGSASNGYTYMGCSTSNSSTLPAGASTSKQTVTSTALGTDLTTYYAYFKLNQYTATATVGNVAGGTVQVTGGSSSSTSSSATQNHGTSVTFAATSSSGYNFVNWNTKADGTGTVKSTSASYTITLTSATTLYAIFAASCTPPTPTTSDTPSAYSYTTATLTGTYPTTSSYCAVTAKGICYGTSANPTTEYDDTTSSSGNISYSATGLNDNTTYYYRAYVVAGGTTYYGEDKSFTTTACTAPEITTQPYDTQNRKYCINTDTPTTLTVVATGGVDSYTYQWQERLKDKSTFSNVTTGTGYQTASFTPSNASAGNRYYRCIVTNESVCTSYSATSNESCLYTINRLSDAGTISGDGTYCQGASGDTQTLTLTDYVGSRQWHKSATSDFTPTNDTKISGATGITYNAPINTTGTMYYKVVVTNGACPSETTGQATVSVDPYPSISSQPTASQSVCGGSHPTSISVTATGTGLSYQWQSKAGENWVDWADKTSSTLTFGAIPYASTWIYRCKITASCGAIIYSDTHTITGVASASITSVTLSSSPVCKGQGLSATANGVVLGGGTGAWSSSNTSVATVNSSETTTTTVATPGAGTANIIYTITGGCGGTQSAQASLTVNPNNSVAGVTISLDKNNVCAGVSVQASKSGTPVVSPGATAQWYSSTSKATIDPSTGAITTNSGGTSNISYRVTGGCGSTVETSAQTLTIKSIPTLTPASSSVENFTPVRIGANEDVTWSVAEQASDSYLFEQTARKTKFKGTVGAGANKTFTVNGTGANGCAGSATVTVTKDNESCN